jgi:hypothetical protein
MTPDLDVEIDVINNITCCFVYKNCLGSSDTASVTGKFEFYIFKKWV